MRVLIISVFVCLAGISLTGQAQAQTSANVTQGQAIAFDRGKGNCLACHTMVGGDVPSSVGPELVDMKSRFPNRADLVAVVSNEQARNPQTVMPPFLKNHLLTAAEIEKIVDFLDTL
jgi:sulfur-oxidizing protein SoxX